MLLCDGTGVHLCLMMCAHIGIHYGVFGRRLTPKPTTGPLDQTANTATTCAPARHVEAVAGLVGRAEVLSGLFFLASVLVYARCLWDVISPAVCGLGGDQHCFNS